MLRLSRLADYAVVVLIRLADRGEVATSTSLAAETGIPEPTVAKVLKALAAAGLAGSQRGARGGYRNLRGLADVSVMEVIVAVDGPVAVTACVDGGDRDCLSSGICPVRGRWDPVNDAIRATLEQIMLADLMRAAPRAGAGLAAGGRPIQGADRSLASL